MFLKAKFALSCALLFILAAGFFRLCYFSKEEAKNWADKAAVTAVNPSSFQQSRTGVVKDLFFTDVKENRRLHSHLESERSLLTLHSFNTQIELVENLEDLSCSMQESIVNSNLASACQYVRFFTAKEGVFHYGTGTFFADSVQLALFKLPGQTLPKHLQTKDLYLKGRAQDVSLSFSPPTFHAQHFNATVFEQQELH